MTRKKKPVHRRSDYVAHISNNITFFFFQIILICDWLNPQMEKNLQLWRANCNTEIDATYKYITIHRGFQLNSSNNGRSLSIGKKLPKKIVIQSWINIDLAPWKFQIGKFARNIQIIINQVWLWGELYDRPNRWRCFKRPRNDGCDCKKYK